MGNCFAKPGQEYCLHENEIDLDRTKEPALGSPACKDTEKQCPALGATEDAAASTDALPTPCFPLEMEFSTANGFRHQTELLGPPLPPCESERLDTIHALNLHGYNLEAPPDPEIENILALMASIFQVPNVLCALFDEKRIFVRETQGGFQRGDFPWRVSFCAWTLSSKQDQIMVIPDATKDARFVDNPNVTTYGVRCYVGAPLVASNGHRLGTLCFADTKPREFDGNQATIMSNFAEMVVRQLEKDIALQLKLKDNDMLTHAYRNLKRAIDALDSCVVLLDTAKPGWQIMYTNPAWEKLTGCSRSIVQGHTLGEVLEQTHTALPSRAHVEMAAAHKEVILDNVRIRSNWLLHQASCSNSALDSASGPLNSRSSFLSDKSSSTQRVSSSAKRFVLKLRPAAASELDANTVALAVPSWVANKANSDIGSTYYFMTVESQEAANAAYAKNMLMLGRTNTGLPSTPLAGLQLGKLLGVGSFGSVYAGTWYGTPVAIKVIQQDMKQLENAGLQMEALLGSELRHPHIVSTLMYTTHTPGEDTYEDNTSIKSGSNLQPRNSRSAHNSKNHSSNNGLTMPALLEYSGEDSDTHAQLSGGNAAALDPSPDILADEPLVYKSEKAMLSPPTSKNDGHGGAVSAPEFLLAHGEGGFNDVQQPSEAFPVINVGVNEEYTPYGTNGSTLGKYHHLMHLSGPATTATPSGSHAGVSHQQTWIVLEYCDKGSLQDAVDRGWLRDNISLINGSVNMGAVVATACEIASALLYLHSHGIVHGDLSAWNVLLTTSGSTAQHGHRGFTAKVADFGLSRALDIKTRVQTKTYGTITHQPPETLVDGIVSRETDTYSLGVLLWQMYTGSRPWAGLSHAQIIMSVASKNARLQFPPDAPEEFTTLANACLSYEAEQRPSMADICEILEALKAKFCNNSD